MNRWLLGARPRTLPAAVVPVVVGTTLAWNAGQPDLRGDELDRVSDDWWAGAIILGRDTIGRIDWWNAALAMLVALALQVATNYANDYSDGKRGTDDPETRIGPPRLVGGGLATASEVKRAVILSFGAALVAGGVLVVRVGWELIPVGIAAVAAGWFYTGGPRPYGYAGLGEVFVFVFFGLVATIGSYYVQVERIPWEAVLAGAACGCWATAMLVVNNLRDIPGDTLSGKRTLAVRIGDQRTRALYASMIAAPFLMLPFLAGLSGRPVGSLAFLAILLATPAVRRVLEGAQGAALIPVLANTGRAQLVYGVLLSVGFVVGSP